MVILLIGILAAVVLPKFVNLTGSANKAASQGVIGSLGEGVTTQLSKDLVNNTLSTYVTVATTGTPTFLPSGTTAAAGVNPYLDPFLALPNYTIAVPAGKGTGTAYNTGTPTALGNSWWLNVTQGTTVVYSTGTGGVTTVTASCNNGSTGPTIQIPVNEAITPLGNIDYVYSNGSTEDSYYYYMVTDLNGNTDGFYLAPCPTGTVQ
ncbi:MAG: hypothetical protein ACYDDB_05770 [bacterium]